jgi:hypothetical protein
MKNTIRQELASHLLDLINDGAINKDNIQEIHFIGFNEDYYLIGYYNCSEWLKRHNIGEFEAVGIVQEYEIETFGESTKVYDNSETVVNMLAYIYGEELLQELNFDTLEELLQELNFDTLEELTEELENI